MRPEHRNVRYVVTFALTGVGFVLFWHLAGGEYGTQGGYVAHPLIRLAILIAWGAVVGAAVGRLMVELPARAVGPLGIGAVLGLVGFILGVVFEIDVLGGALIDGIQNVHMISGLTGAGIGWILGALIGSVVTRTAPPATTRQRRILRGLALTIGALGVVASRVEPYFSTSGHREGLYLSSARTAVIALSLLVALTLLVAARKGSSDEGSAGLSDRRAGAGWFATAGLLLGSALLILTIVTVPQWNEVARTQRDRSLNSRTATRLDRVASRVADRTGTYPRDIDELIAAGGRLPDGSVAKVRWVGRRYCIIVGRDDGNGSAVDPLEYTLLIPPSPGRGALVSAGGSGDRCR